MNNDKKLYLKLVSVGNEDVGKTCLYHRFAYKKYPSEYIPTVFESYVYSLETKYGIAELALWDTAGEEQYKKNRPLSYPNTDVFILCFSINDRNSFDNISNQLIGEITQHGPPKTPIILVGTKVDLYDDESQNQKDLIQFNEGKALAKKINAIDYIETSSITGKNVDKVFETITETIFNNKNNKNNNNNKSNNCNIL